MSRAPWRGEGPPGTSGTGCGVVRGSVPPCGVRCRCPAGGVRVSSVSQGPATASQGSVCVRPAPGGSPGFWALFLLRSALATAGGALRTAGPAKEPPPPPRHPKSREGPGAPPFSARASAVCRGASGPCFLGVCGASGSVCLGFVRGGCRGGARRLCLCAAACPGVLAALGAAGLWMLRVASREVFLAFLSLFVFVFVSVCLCLSFSVFVCLCFVFVFVFLCFLSLFLSCFVFLFALLLFFFLLTFALVVLHCVVV